MAYITADHDVPDDVADLRIVGAKIIEPQFDGNKIVGGRIVGGEVISEKNVDTAQARARQVDRHNAHTEIVAVLVLGLAIIVFCLLQ
jgi:hypothetical protein